jgi:predicted nucleotidyltransferase
VVDEAKAAGTRKGSHVLLMEGIADFNREEDNRQYRIQTDEISAIKFMSSRSPEFLKQLKMIWGTQRPQFTAIPMNVLSEKWLQPEEPLPALGP